VTSGWGLFNQAQITCPEVSFGGPFDMTKHIVLSCLLLLSAAAVAAQPVPSLAVPLDPCRIFDSRTDPGTVLLNGTTTLIAVRDLCLIPANANGVFLTAAATGATSAGHLIVWGGETLLPAASSMNYRGNGVDSSGLFARLCYPQLECGVATYGSGTADLAVRVVAAPTHVILDIVGYTVPMPVVDVFP
jgi:hypothetical protein